MTDPDAAPSSAEPTASPTQVAAAADRVQISAAQVLASSLAAVSAAVVCSLFGVTGTIIGTAIASASATTASALYAHSLRRTRARLARMRRPEPVITASAVLATAKADLPQRLRALPWRMIAVTSVGVFLIAAATVTLIEVGIGTDLSNALRGGGGGGRSTSFIPVHEHNTPAVPPTPATTGPTPSPQATTSSGSPGPTTVSSSASPTTTSAAPTPPSSSPAAPTTSASLPAS